MRHRMTRDNLLPRLRDAFDFAQRQVRQLIESRPGYYPMYTVEGRWGREGELWTHWCHGTSGSTARLPVPSGPRPYTWDSSQAGFRSTAAPVAAQNRMRPAGAGAGCHGSSCASSKNPEVEATIHVDHFAGGERQLTGRHR